MRIVWRALSGIGTAIRARPGTFVGAAAAVFLLDVLLPPIVLSLARKPVDYFTFNPWLPKLPEFVASSAVTLQRKLEFLPGLALFWFSSDGPMGEPEWGFAVTVTDLARFLALGLLFGAYFALWAYARDHRAAGRWASTTARQGGIAASLSGVLGFSTGACSVMGCGAPVMPVVGLAFAGLTSGTIHLLSELSKAATVFVLAITLAGVAYFGWRVGAADARSTAAATATVLPDPAVAAARADAGRSRTGTV